MRSRKRSLPICVLIALSLTGCAVKTGHDLAAKDYGHPYHPSGNLELDAAPSEDSVVCRFRLVCEGETVYTVPVAVRHRGGTPRWHEASSESPLYEVRVRRGGEVELAVEAGVQGDVAWDAQRQTYGDIDLDAPEERFELKGRRFDGAYLAKAVLSTATVPPRGLEPVAIRNRFEPFVSASGRPMIYDHALRCTWYYPDRPACTYDEAKAFAEGLGERGLAGELPTLDDLTTLMTDRPFYGDHFLHPAFVFRLGAGDVRVWTLERTRCVAFKKRYAPRVNPRQPSATLLVCFRGDLRPAAAQ